VDAGANIGDVSAAVLALLTLQLRAQYEHFLGENALPGKPALVDTEHSGGSTKGVLPFALLMQMMSAGAMGGGVVSAIARALGAGRREDASAMVLHAILIALGVAAVLAIGPHPALRRKAQQPDPARRRPKATGGCRLDPAIGRGPKIAPDHPCRRDYGGPGILGQQGPGQAAPTAQVLHPAAADDPVPGKQAPGLARCLQGLKGLRAELAPEGRLGRLQHQGLQMPCTKGQDGHGLTLHGSPAPETGRSG
jgi:hypothetical protein